MNQQARARFRRAVESGEKAMQALQKAQANFEPAQQEMMQSQTDLDRIMEEAPLPVTVTVTVTFTYISCHNATQDTKGVVLFHIHLW